MKSPDFTVIYEPTVVVIPPELSDKIRSHYRRRIRNGNISRRALEPFCRRFMYDDAYCDGLMRISEQLGDVVFDPNNSSWGRLWPIDIEEATAVGFILGVIFENMVESAVLELPEQILAQLETKSRAQSRSLCDLLLEELTRCKEAAGLRGDEA